MLGTSRPHNHQQADKGIKERVERREHYVKHGVPAEISFGVMTELVEPSFLADSRIKPGGYDPIPALELELEKIDGEGDFSSQH